MDAIICLGTLEHYLYQWNTAHFSLIEWTCLVGNTSLTVTLLKSQYPCELTERYVLEEVTLRHGQERFGKMR